MILRFQHCNIRDFPLPPPLIFLLLYFRRLNSVKRLVQGEGCNIFSGLSFSFFFSLVHEKSFSFLLFSFSFSHAVSSLLKKKERKFCAMKRSDFGLRVFRFHFLLVNKLYQRFIVSSHEFELSSVYLGFSYYLTLFLQLLLLVGGKNIPKIEFPSSHFLHLSPIPTPQVT